jgi:ATP-dependent exoDNAse (exonuclease V) alpha subunit
MNRLIIDEVSMVRVDLIDSIDARLRSIRNDPRPFGGVQVVMVGDFLQLPPVVEDEHRSLLHALGYRTPYAFSAHSLGRKSVASITLDHVYRQEEREFVDLLNKVRLAQDADEVTQILNARCMRDHRPEFQPLLLTPTRAAAERYNCKGLAKLPGPSSTFNAQIIGKLDIAKDRLPVPEHRELRVGTRVMAAKNDPLGRWINGSLGSVTRIQETDVFVRFDASKQEHPVGIVGWDKVRQTWNKAEQEIENEVIASYRQLPLIHAWAITIHKAQGLTLDDVRLDLDAGAFAPGQTYVALSRVRAMSGLSLTRPLRVSDLQADPILLAFTEWVNSSKAATQ